MLLLKVNAGNTKTHNLTLYKFKGFYILKWDTQIYHQDCKKLFKTSNYIFKENMQTIYYCWLKVKAAIVSYCC